MTSRSLFSSLGLLCSLGLFACTWPWPSATEDTTGLGKSELARMVRNHCCSNGAERVLARNITMALGKTTRGQSYRAVAESFGFTCEDPPSKTCRYAGEMTYQVHGVPEKIWKLRRYTVCRMRLPCPTTMIRMMLTS